MTPAKNTTLQTPRLLAARRAGIRLVAKGHLTPESLHSSPWSSSAAAPNPSSLAGASKRSPCAGGGDLGRSHSAWLDTERSVVAASEMRGRFPSRPAQGPPQPRASDATRADRP